MTSSSVDSPKNIGSFAKLRLLLWKNCLLRNRHYIQTIGELFLPVCFLLIFAWIHRHIDQRHLHQRTFSSQSIDGLEPLW